jgi:hypothetical protein
MKDKPNIKLIILIILSILSVFSLIRGAVAPTKSKRRVSSESGPVASKGAVSLTEEGLSLERNAKRSNYNSWSRNPFTIGTSIKAGSEDTLEGIIWDEKLPLALINGKTVKIGDKVGLDRVTDIQKNKVILNDGTRDRELQLR